MQAWCVSPLLTQRAAPSSWCLLRQSFEPPCRGSRRRKVASNEKGSDVCRGRSRQRRCVVCDARTVDAPLAHSFGARAAVQVCEVLLARAGARCANGYRRGTECKTAAVRGDWGGADEASISSNRPRVSWRESVVCVRASVVCVVHTTAQCLR
jgi:hypothetical protein